MEKNMTSTDETTVAFMLRLVRRRAIWQLEMIFMHLL